MSDFVAWIPDDDALDALQAARSGLLDALPDSRALQWRSRRQLHMTLRFLHAGLPEEPAPLYAALADVAARTPRIPLTVDRLELWPRAGVLVARTAPEPELDTLFARIEDAVATFEPRERRSPAPHLTLAYAPRRGHAFPAGLEDALPATPLPLPAVACLGRIALARTVPGGYDTPHWWPLQDCPADA